MIPDTVVVCNVIIECRHAGDEATWFETYEEGQSGLNQGMDAKAWAIGLIENFNATLNRGERRRELVGVKVTTGAPVAHAWEKTNAMTRRSHDNRAYDTLRCRTCGVTARRYGLLNIKHDAGFTAQGFNTCGGAIRLLQKRAAKAAGR